MFGKSKDVDGDCNARLFLSDDYGDNVCSIRCALSLNHRGLHQESFERGKGRVIIQWEDDERGQLDRV